MPPGSKVYALGSIISKSRRAVKACKAYSNGSNISSFRFFFRALSYIPAAVSCGELRNATVGCQEQSILVAIAFHGNRYLMRSLGCKLLQRGQDFVEGPKICPKPAGFRFRQYFDQCLDPWQNLEPSRKLRTRTLYELRIATECSQKKGWIALGSTIAYSRFLARYGL